MQKAILVYFVRPKCSLYQGDRERLIRRLDIFGSRD